MNKSGLLIFLTLLGFSCIEPYDFEAVGTIKAIVVDGTLTDQQKAHTVQLTYTRPIDTDERLAVTGATIWIDDDDGFRTDLKETEPGLYLTDSSFAGVVGQTYTLNFITSDGQSFISTPEKLIASPPINSIYGAYTSLPSTENETVLNGVQFFVDTEVASGSSSSFRYEYVEAYAIKVLIPPKFMLLRGDIVPRLREPPLETCYRTNKSTSLILATTQGLSAKRISEFPVRFVTDTDPELAYAYSLMLRQYAISNDAYNFYQSARANNEFSGSLFDEQKGSVDGNIRSLDELTIPVLGYFEVAGVSIATRLFRPEEFAHQGFFIPEIFTGCQDPITDTIFGEGPQLLIDTIMLRDGTVGYDSSYTNIFGVQANLSPDTVNMVVYDRRTFEIIMVRSEFCGDCRLHGRLNPPAFWSEDD